MISKTRFFSGLLLLWGTTLAQMNIAPHLESIGFNQPVSTGSLKPSFTLENEDLPLLALAVRSSKISIVPKGESPWWQYQVNQGGHRGPWLYFPAGSRTVVSRTNRREWKEGPFSFFAETITYEVRFDKAIVQAIGVRPFRKDFRLVLVEDPAVGYWKVFEAPMRGTDFSDQTDIIDATKWLKSAALAANWGDAGSVWGYITQHIDSVASLSQANAAPPGITSSGAESAATPEGAKASNKPAEIFGPGPSPDFEKVNVQARYFPERSHEIEAGYDAVWEGLHKVLSNLDEIVRIDDKESGILITERTKHGLPGIGFYKEYLIYARPAEEGKTKLVFKVIRHKFSGDKVTLETNRKYIDKSDDHFVSSLRKVLVK